jgi:hypothetical protein
MSKLLINVALILLTNCAIAQKYLYEGVSNMAESDADFAKGSDAIAASITDNLNNLNLYEYSHALAELCQLIEAGKITTKRWTSFIDSLKNEVTKHKNDTLRPYWGVDYVGLIPLQCQFFLASLEKNQQLKKRFPRAFDMLLANTKMNPLLAYKKEDFHSLLVFSEVVGETNFWFFFQLEDCRLIEEVILKNPELKTKFDNAIKSIEIIATYKTPYYLQKRKIQTLERRLASSQNEICRSTTQALKKRSIMIADKNRNYFIEGAKEGIDRNKLKNF